jgi:predicted nucleic acid-binding Zn ribbon protein
MKKRTKENQSLSEVLKDFVDHNKLQGGLDKVSVRDVWNREMGPAIQKYTTAIKLQNDTLYVQLSSSVLREELSYGKEKIIRMLNEELGKDLVKKLVLR